MKKIIITISILLILIIGTILIINYNKNNNNSNSAKIVNVTITNVLLKSGKYNFYAKEGEQIEALGKIKKIDENDIIIENLDGKVVSYSYGSVIKIWPESEVLYDEPAECVIQKIENSDNKNVEESNDNKTVKITSVDTGEVIFAKEGDEVNIGTIKEIEKIGKDKITIINDYGKKVNYFYGINIEIWPDSQNGTRMSEYPIGTYRFDIAQ